jgi:hypothetical protein
MSTQSIPNKPSRVPSDRSRWYLTAVFGGVVALVGAVALVGVMPSTAARADTVTPPSTPTSIVISQPSVAPEVTVSWTPGAGSAPTGAAVQLWGKTATGAWASQSTSTCSASCQSVIFRYLHFGTTYEAAVWATNSAGYAPAGASNIIVLTNSCSVGLCINVDSTRTVGPAAGQDSGILHSIYPNPGEASRLAPLNIGMWRSSFYGSLSDNTSRWAVVAANNTPVTLILSDKWASDTAGASVTPWSNWTAYRNWVVASVQQLQAAGIRVDYWEVYNEPDAMTTNYYPPAQAATVTPALLLTQFLVTYQAIKSILPDAKIIGPSTANWEETPSATTFSMAQFLDFAAANNLSLAALSWHFNTGSPQAIEDQVAEARALLAARPALGTPSIFINEFGAAQLQRIPGWDVEYLSALTAAGVDSAGRSCWDGDCWAPVLDGLLAPDGSSTLPDYWARIAYAQMTGTMLASAASSDSVGVLSSINTAQTQIQVLLGYGNGCVQDPRCAATTPWASLAPNLSTQLSVRVPWTTGQVSVSETRIPGTSITAIPQPAAQNLGTVPITGGSANPTVTLNVGTVSDGDAWSLTLTHTS